MTYELKSIQKLN